MKIVDLKTLLSMPIGTIFQKAKPCVLDGVEIFQGRIGESDFCSTHLNFLPGQSGIDDMFDYGASVPLDFEDAIRDAAHRHEQLFAIWERDDVQALIAQLAKTLQEMQN